MPFNFEQLEAEAMRLPVAARALLADLLVESLELAQPDEIQRLWSAEAVRRRDEIRSGRMHPIAGDEVLGEARDLIRR